MRLHLGCGDNYIAGWVNIDIAGKVDLLADLRNPLPFMGQSISFIFSEHFIEHLTYDEGLNFLAECYRVLKPEGVVRISTPSLDYLIECYERRKIWIFSDMGWTPQSPCKFINEGMRLWGHLFVYDFEELVNSFQKTGFCKISSRDWRESKYKELENLERRPPHKEIILEATK